MNEECVNHNEKYIPYNALEKEKRFYIFFWSFFICGTLGTLYETILTFVLHQRFEYRSGCIIGFVNFVYGAGGLIIIAFFCNMKRTIHGVFFKGALLGGIMEFTMSVLEELFLGTRSWNYSNRFLNIGGRTTVPYMVFWGLLCLGCVYVVYPIVVKVIEKLYCKTFRVITVILFSLMLVDYLLSLLCIVRQKQRVANASVKKLAKLIDKIFSEKYIMKRYPKMKW